MTYEDEENSHPTPSSSRMEGNSGCILVSHVTGEGNESNEYGISGIFLSDGWILTHGTLLSPVLSDTYVRGLSDFVDVLEEDLVGVPPNLTESMKFHLQYKSSSGVADEKSKLGGEEWVEKKVCSLRVVWRCSLLRETFADFLSWSFEKSTKYDKSLLSIFLLFKIDTDCRIGEDDVARGKRVLRKLYDRVTGRSGRGLRRGSPVEVISAPFGNPVFLDSISRGIVSNILGRRGCLILIDAHTVPGCEGAALLDFPHPDRATTGRICGVVIAALSWCRGEWVNYTFAANLQPCLEKLLRVPDANIATDSTLSSFEGSPLPDSLDNAVVVIESDSGWGTGIVLDVSSGVILTCSHVVRKALGSRVKVVLFKDRGLSAERNGAQEMWARLEYRTPDGQPYDVAVLKLDRHRENLRSLVLASDIPLKGTNVMTLGFPFFAARNPPSWCRGIISRQTTSMIQTTCCVQSGASGGPVISCDTGQVLGMIVSNAISTTASEALYPRFNMAVPAIVLRKPITDYIQTGDIKCLESLRCNDPRVQATWNFYLTPTPKL